MQMHETVNDGPIGSGAARSRPAAPNDAVVRAWARLLRAQAILLGQVEARLSAAGLPPLEWYDVLLELERDGPARPRDLQARLLLAQSNLSRLIDRMAAAGMVVRQACAEDGRGHLVAISADGRTLRRRIWPVYAEAMAAAFGDRLTEAELEQLGALLGRLCRPIGER